MPEYADVVDENDVVVERRPLRECLDEGLLHRAVVIFIRNSRGEIYLQKRSPEMRFYPNFWTASCTGHVSAGESYLEGGLRELTEELGITCDLELLGKFTSPKWKITNGVDWEIVSVFSGVSDDPIVLSDESVDGKFVAPKEFETLASADPPVLTPDTLLSLKLLHTPM